MKIKTKLLAAHSSDSDCLGNDELATLKRSLADVNDLSYLSPDVDKEAGVEYVIRVLKELEEDMEAMLEDILSESNERDEQLLATLDEEEDDILNDEWVSKLVERLLAEFDEDEFE